MAHEMPVIECSPLTLYRVIKRSCHYPLTIRVEVERHDLRSVPEQRVQTFPRFNIEEPSIQGHHEACNANQQRTLFRTTTGMRGCTPEE